MCDRSAEEGAGQAQTSWRDRATLERLVADGLTIEQIAEQVDRHVLTVSRRLASYGLKTRGAGNPAARSSNQTAEPCTVQRVCKHHGETDFVVCGDGYFRCRRCRVDSLTRRRRRVKETLVQEAGGCCQVCGYERYVGALQFHHIDPEQKRIGLGKAGLVLAIDKLREETRKCVLLCANCHAEVEAGLISVPIK